MSGERFLLDSNIFVSLESGNRRITPSILERLDGAEDCFLSAATYWELGLKVMAGKLQLLHPIQASMQMFQLTELPVLIRHGEVAVNLPIHHKDPFDRMLIAQALVEGLILVTGDKKLAEYGVPILLV